MPAACYPGWRWLLPPAHLPPPKWRGGCALPWCRQAPQSKAYPALLQGAAACRGVDCVPRRLKAPEASKCLLTRVGIMPGKHPPRTRSASPWKGFAVRKASRTCAAAKPTPRGFTTPGQTNFSKLVNAAWPVTRPGTVWHSMRGAGMRPKWRRGGMVIAWTTKLRCQRVTLRPCAWLMSG